MNKKLITGLISLALSLPHLAFAGKVEVTGETSLKYQQTRAEGEPGKAGAALTLTLQAESKLDETLSVYTRLGAQKVSRAEFREFSNPDGGRKSALAIDQLGLVYAAVFTTG